MTIARDIEIDIHPLGARDPGIDLIFQPVLRNLLLNHMHVPRVLCPKIAAASGNSKPTLVAGCAERSVRTAHWPALSKRNLIRLFLGRRLRLLLGNRLLFFLRFYFYVL